MNIAQKGIKSVNADDVPTLFEEGAFWGKPGMILFSPRERLSVKISDHTQYSKLQLSLDSNDKYLVSINVGGVVVYSKEVGPAVPEMFGTKAYQLDLNAQYIGGVLEIEAIAGDDFLSLGFLSFN